ncbi:MAG: DEAD/DEAH box helicase family protein [Lachnospiraceae bacterium]|nr:DEAD/DEAH box helicase family protein [Lachnospiraceae bacterium]
MNICDVLQFRGTWRTYQARVLERAERYLDDGCIHIVAAPGSGKTTLGIELVRKLSEPALILAPTVTIREQWKTRIEEGFLKEGIDVNAIVSQDLKSPSLITIATYQALHSAMTKYAGILEEETDEGTEDSNAVKVDVDFSEFDLVSVYKEAGIKVLCLDECHHLRSEWWKALEQFKQEMGQVTVVALTATPPYDSTPSMWNRYINMCGEIDEEITIPELVKDGSLCPHQDFVYFNYPTREEEKSVKEHMDKAKAMLEELLQDDQLLSGVRGHAFFSGLVSTDEILDDPAYLSSLLIYLQARGVDFPQQYKRMLGANRLPDINSKWMETLLQQLLFEHTEHFLVDAVFVEQLTDKLKLEGLIEKRKVILQKSGAVEKMLTTSKGKVNSILDIATHEYRNLGTDLRMLILTDYIRKEVEKALGKDEVSIDTLGVLPFFEQLRRHFAKDMKQPQPKLGVLCGSVVIIPASAKDALLQAVGGDKISFVSAGQLSQEEYVKVTAVGDAHFLTGAVTDIFAAGYIHILVGTKSLLGEGWDSPCINSLILASFVGSYMLSNQMRGRAIRAMKDNPDKTSNIWHSVCLYPEKTSTTQGEEISEDFMLLKRRMKHFLGLHYEMDYIESGIERLSYIKPPFNRHHVEHINKQMLALSDQRQSLKEGWEKALEIHDQMEVVRETEVETSLLDSVVIYDAIRDVIFSTILMVLSNVGLRVSDQYEGTFLGTCCFVMIGFALVELFMRIPKLFMLRSPYKRLQYIGKGIRKALVSQGMLEDPRCRVKVESDAVNHCVYLTGGTGRDKTLFAECVMDFYSPVENQRYLLVQKKHHKCKNGYYCVPNVFAGKKELATAFLNSIRPYLGNYELVYTRNEEGRKILLTARVKALANKQKRCLSKEKVKSALE